MKSKKIYFASKPLFVLTFVLVTVFVALLVLSCVFVDFLGIFPIILSALLFPFSLVGVWTVFNNFILINVEEKEIKLSANKFELLSFDSISNIMVVTEEDINGKAHAKIVFLLKNRKEIACGGVFSILKRNDEEKSQKIVDKIFESMGYIVE